jgi:hypothetical protein
LQPYHERWICEAHVGQFLWKQGLQDEYSFLLTCHLCCSSCDFSKQSLSVYGSLFLSVLIFAPYSSSFLLADVFPRVLYADITLETVALDTPNNMAVFIRDAPTKRKPTICPLSKSGHSLIFLFFPADCHLTQSLNH